MACQPIDFVVFVAFGLGLSIGLLVAICSRGHKRPADFAKGGVIKSPARYVVGEGYQPMETERYGPVAPPPKKP